jgi:Tol biopolymer transport system component/predicted Ser/Thr protein kinase
MAPERWEQIARLHRAGLEREESQRAAFLREACAGDEDLRREVESLLAYEKPGEGFLESPALEAAARLLARQEDQQMQGRTFSHYQIQEKLGAGGMGVVYKARDTRLGRSVAVKFVNSEFSNRGQREARVVAALNHPNICTLHDVGPNFLVMELIDGPTLAERMAQGHISLQEALAICRQIAEALEAAHEKGVVHRDLKPANIKFTAEGTVKVLDFGLAKAMEPAAAGGPEDSPTVTGSATQAGIILGTAGYMSPEQASGKPVDKRADIWSFGVVLWELLNFHRLFEGETVTQTLAAVLRGPIEFDRLPRDTPPGIRFLLRRCLERNAKNRLRDIGEARIAIEAALAGETPLMEGAPATAHRPWLAWGVATMATVCLATLAYFREAPPAHVRLAQFVVEPPAGAEFVNTLSTASVSPDGRYLVFRADTGADSVLWLRPIDTLNARRLPGTEYSDSPFWSPDSKSIGFFSGGKLKRTDIAGGAPQALCDAMVAGSGGTWNRDGIILFGQGAGLLRVPASGGAPQIVTQPDSRRKEGSHSEPQFLPDGIRFLYFISSADAGVRGIYAGSLDRPGDRLRILATDHKASYVPPAGGRSGFLLWIREQSLLAQPFDEGHLRLEGEATPVAENVGQSSFANAAFFTSDTGILVYQSGIRPQMRKLVWMSRDGKTQGQAGKEEYYGQLRLSRDGTRLAVTIWDGNGYADIWALDLGRAIMSRLTFSPAPRYNPAWSPDGRQITYDSNQTGIRQLYRIDAGGAGQEEQLTSGPDHKGVSDWSPDGRYLLYQDLNPITGFDLGILPLGGEREHLVLKTPFSKVEARFSPDGNWIAYMSRESGRYEVYLRAFPVSGGQWQVSSQGGSQPRWRADGKELYYLEPASNGVMATGVHIVGGNIQSDVPRKLFTIPAAPDVGSYDVTADGQRFIVFEDVNTAERPAPLTVVLNWQAGLQK